MPRSTCLRLVLISVDQVDEIAPRLNSMALVRAALQNVTQELLGRLNITADVEPFVGNIVNGLQSCATRLLQNTPSVFTGFLSLYTLLPLSSQPFT
jgi:hypothetical protein